MITHLLDLNIDTVDKEKTASRSNDNKGLHFNTSSASQKTKKYENLSKDDTQISQMIISGNLEIP